MRLASEETILADLVLDFQPPELRENNLLLGQIVVFLPSNPSNKYKVHVLEFMNYCTHSHWQL